MKCNHCGYEWMAVAPVEATRLECPECSKFTQVDPLTLDTVTWEELTRGLTNYSEPDQTYGAAD